MRLGIAQQTVEQQIDAMRLQIEELKTAQLTSQNSGMLGHICTADQSDQYGDIVQFSTSNSQPRFISRIPLQQTAGLFSYNNIQATQTFIPKHGKPAAVTPMIQYEVKTNGYRGKSNYFIASQGWGVSMDVFDASNTKVANVTTLGSLNELFRPIYHPTNRYTYNTSISYSSIVPNIELCYQFTVRSSDKGVTSSVLRGFW